MISKDQLALIAGYELALGAAENVKGAEGFADFYLKSRSRPELLFLRRYLRIRDDVRKSAIAALEADGPLAESYAAAPSSVSSVGRAPAASVTKSETPAPDSQLSTLSSQQGTGGAA